MKLDADGSRSDGLSTNVLPQAIAIGCIHMGTITGKLNGVIPAHTPSGWRKEKASTSVDTWSEYSPFRSCGRPHAYSTTSSPRMISPLASSTTLPCSEAISRASSSMRASTRLRNANMTFARHVAPRLERGLGGGDRGIDVGRLGQQDLGLLLARRRIPDRRGAVRVAGGRAPGDAVLDAPEGRRAHGVLSTRWAGV